MAAGGGGMAAVLQLLGQGMRRRGTGREGAAKVSVLRAGVAGRGRGRWAEEGKAGSRIAVPPYVREP